MIKALVALGRLSSLDLRQREKEGGEEGRAYIYTLSALSSSGGLLEPSRAVFRH